MDTTTQGLAAQNREDLRKVFSASGYQDIKYWLHPSCAVTKEEAEAEVLTTLKTFLSNEKIVDASAELV